MQLYKNSYKMLYQMLPFLDRLPITREPYVLSNDVTNISVHVHKRTRTHTVIGVSYYRLTSWGEYVPSPDVEISLCHASGQAVPLLYLDMYLGRVELDESGRRKKPILSKQLDLAVYKWLAGFQITGLRPPQAGMPSPEL